MIPYGRQSINEDDIRAVERVLRSGWLTTGPEVVAFEEELASGVSAGHAVAVANGTAALHCAMFALGIKPGDEVIVPTMTFAATANCVAYMGGVPVFADILPDSLLIDPVDVRRRVSDRTKAIIGMDHAGHPCDWDALGAIAKEYGLKLVDDACHALGAEYKGRPVGSLADVSVFSFHPVKHVATGEGGMVVTDDKALADRARLFRNHGISTDFRQREKAGSWQYEMIELGYNYRLTDIQCALGRSQYARISSFLERRRAIAARYDEQLESLSGVRAQAVSPDVSHAYHLYVILLDDEATSRDKLFNHMRKNGVGVNVHYSPVHLHPYYREKFTTAEGLCPVAEKACGQILSLPVFPDLTDEDQSVVIEVLRQGLEA